MLLRFIASVTALLIAWGVAQEAEGTQPPEGRPFAALTILSNGRQTVDLVTGLTTLPDGGRLMDARTGVEVLAQVIRYVEGEYIEATAVTVTGVFGEVTAEALRIDVKTSLLTATGELRLARDGLRVSATSLRYDAVDQVAGFDGGVAGTEPTFSADRVLLDILTGDVLLDGRYEYAGGLFTMRSPEVGGRLQLTLQQVGEAVTYAATTEVSPALLERFKAYL